LLFVNQVPVFRLATDARAQVLATELRRDQTGSVRVEMVGSSAYLRWGSNVIATIEPSEAKLYGQTPRQLADTWASKLNPALSLPAIKLTTVSMRLAPGAVGKVGVTGSSAEVAVARSEDNSIVGVDVDGPGLTLRAYKPGRARVVVEGGDGKQAIDVFVLPFAVKFPQTVTALVTGAPATVDTVRGSIHSALLSQVIREPGTKLTYSIDRVTSLASGSRRTYSINVRSQAPNALASQGVVNVSVQNSPIPPMKEAELLFSNKPEALKGPGDYYWGMIGTDQPVRMLYHHVNRSGSELFVKVELLNLGSQPAEALLIPGDSAPSKNPTLAGLQAADQFARNWVSNSAEIVRIPANGSLPIAVRKLYIGQTMSGLCSIRLLPGGPEALTVRVSAMPPFPLDDRWADALNSSTPWHELGTMPVPRGLSEVWRPSEHVYAAPTLESDFSYRIGDTPTIFRLGTTAEIKRRDGTTKLSGNFGVIYNLRTILENPTKQAKQVEMLFRASGGYSGGLFLIDGQVVRTPLLNPHQEVVVTVFKVEPGIKRFITIQTMPLSGSSYPATITMRMREGK
jgi:hypothetical protein